MATRRLACHGQGAIATNFRPGDGGLFGAGQPDLARRLSRETLAMIQRHPDIYEYYNPLTGERPPKAAPIFGWTSAVFIDLALQETRDKLEQGAG